MSPDHSLVLNKEEIPMAVTAKELAALLGLSEAAVSLALNNKPGVSTATRKRIIETARQQGYDFSRKAGRLSATRGEICLVIYKKSGAVVSDTPFFSQLIDGISLSCRKYHLGFVTRYVYEDDDVASQIFDLQAHSFAGLIVLATEMKREDLDIFAKLEVPLVFLDAYYDIPTWDFVCINNSQGAFMAASYLIRKRKAQPGYLRSNYPISNFDQRADGFYRAVRAAGMSASQSIVHRLTPSQEGAYEDMKQLLKEGEKPASCYFADNDLIALGAAEAFREAGFRIPEDIALVGFDDLPACEYMTPGLTTVAVPKQYMGEVSVLRLLHLIDGGPSLPLSIQIFTRLVRRRSV